MQCVNAAAVQNVYMIKLISRKTREIRKNKVFEPCHERNLHFAYAKTKTQISCAVAAQLISAFVFAT